MFHLRSIRQSVRCAAFILAVGTCSAIVCFYTAFAKGRIDPLADLPDAELEICELEQRVILEGLVNVCTLDPSIMVDIVFAGPENIIGENVYGDFAKAYLRPEAAWKLARASEILQTRHRHLRILVADALRPRSVQHTMWTILAGTPLQLYVANPFSGSMHNYGTAVDVTLYDMEAGQPLDMGTPMHYFGALSQPILENHYLRKGKLSERQIQNRLILRNAIEWWHFDAFTRDYVRRTYTIIE